MEKEKGRTRLKEIKRIAKWRKEEGRKAAEKALLEKLKSFGLQTIAEAPRCHIAYDCVDIDAHGVR